MKKLIGMAVLAPVLAIGAPTDARADDTLCNTTSSGNFDNVIAVPGGTCILSAATVEGNVKAENGSDLIIFGGTVGGSVQGEWGSSVAVVATIVGGDIQCDGAVGPNGCHASSANVGGNVQSADAEGGFVNIFSSVVGGDVQVFGSAVPSFISLNTIGGNLQCKDNFPAPSPGGLPPTNIVGGNKEDQCDASLGF